MILTAEMVANYHRDGYLLIPSLFNSREVGACQCHGAWQRRCFGQAGKTGDLA